MELFLFFSIDSSFKVISRIVNVMDAKASALQSAEIHEELPADPTADRMDHQCPRSGTKKL